MPGTRTPHSPSGKRPPRAHWIARALAVLLAAVLGFCLGAGAFLLLNLDTLIRAQSASARAPRGRVTGWAVHLGPGTGLLESPVTTQELEEIARQQTARATAGGANALFVFLETPAGAACRVKQWPVMQALTARQGLLRRPDALAALCRAASDQGLSVYAVLDGAAAQPADHLYRAAAAAVGNDYPVAGVYVRDAAGQYLSYSDFSAQTGAACPNGAVFSPPSPLAGLSDGGSKGAAQALRFAAQGGAGAVLDGALQSDPGAAGLAVNALASDYPQLLGYQPPQTLSVTYPQLDPSSHAAQVNTSQVFVMGTSDPSRELTVNGRPVERYGEKGLFGVLLTNLAEGSNRFTFAQAGGASLEIDLQRPVSQPPPLVTEPEEIETPEGSEPSGPPHDGTVEVEPGTFVQMNNTITNLLYDPSSDGNINETLRSGAVGQVVSCAETTRGGLLTWAYQLTSGDWVLASNTVILGKDVPLASFTGAQAQTLAMEPGAGLLGSGAAAASGGGRTELLTFQGTGTPIAYTNHIDDTLSLRFYDTVLAPDFSVTGSQLVTGVQVKPFDGGCELVLQFDEPLWGHMIAYADGGVQVTVKRAPRRAQDPTQPLSGVSVLLDAGHGGTDPGAMGAGGAGAPNEKDLNLAAAMAAGQRLEQLGATVYMIRTDDTFLSLEERNEAISRLHPDFFISLHQNSIQLTANGNDAFGTECYYFYPMGKQLAQALVHNVTQTLGRRDRGAQWSYYYVTRNTMCPAVLLELGFIVSPAEYESLSDDTDLWAAGDAVARAVLDVLPA